MSDVPGMSAIFAPPCRRGDLKAHPRRGEIQLPPVGEGFVPDPDADYVQPATGQPLQVEGGGRPTRIRLQLNYKPFELRQVDVMNGLPIADATPPHLVWDPAAGKAKVQEPALLLHNTKLTLKVTMFGGKPGGAATLSCEVKRRGLALTLKKAVDSSRFGGEWEAILESDASFSDKIAVHELELVFSLEVDGKKTPPIHKTPAPLRIYTIHKAPVKNTKYPGSEPHAGKVHLEHACRWADNATENIGKGSKSIPHRVNNEMRHYVHPKEWKAPDQHYVSVYAAADALPLNYEDLPGSVSGGNRSVSSFYYPPLEVTKTYEPYSHYENNFGWKVLDNKTHTGGRCNQQASLFCEILGTLGIKASVYYLHRVGFGQRTGRPMRRFFNCYAGGQFWNFHGIAKVQLDDGTFHMYDGSFSSPPSRKNGDEKWAIGEKGPFIYSWSPDWQYEDARELVPTNDWPTSWDGVP
jgi:hypothetical protein